MKITIGQLRQLIREAMVSPSQASEGGIALCSFSNSTFETHVLYDAERMFTSVTKSTSDFYTGSKWAIVGAIKVAQPKEEKYYQVVDVKADKGYGPLLYDIALSAHGSLTPSTVDVSPAAQKVWNYYRTKRAKGKKADVSLEGDKAIKPIPGKRIPLRGLRAAHDTFKDNVIEYFMNPRNQADKKMYEEIKGAPFVPNEFISEFEAGLESAASDYLSALHM